MLAFSIPAIASSTMYEGQERDDCFSLYPHGDTAANCIYDKWQQSNKNIDTLVKNTARKIINNQSYIDPFDSNSDKTKADVYKERFLQSQKTWGNYKKTYCLSIVTPVDTDGFDYPLLLEQCEINMNKRRMEEINMMDITSD